MKGTETLGEHRAVALGSREKVHLAAAPALEIDHPRVVVTPHIAYETVEAQQEDHPSHLDTIHEISRVNKPPGENQGPELVREGTLQFTRSNCSWVSSACSGR